MIKNLFIITGLFFFNIILMAQSVSLIENFETGLPGSAPSSETTVTLSSGAWKINGSFGKSDNGSMRLAMNTNGYAITPAINKPTSITFVHRGSGSGKILTVQKSVNGGANWTTIGTVTVNSASAYGSASISVGEAGTKNVLIRFTCSSATIYVDNLQIVSSGMGDEPTQQASLLATEVGGSSMKINFGKGNGSGRLLIYSKGIAPSWLPEDGVHYTNLPKTIETNVVAAHSGDVESILITGLEAGETYHFAVFEYSNENNQPNYITSTIGRLQQRTSEVPSLTINPSGISFGSVKTGTSSTRSITLSAKYLDPAGGTIVLTSSNDFQVSTNSSGGYSSSISIPYSSGGVDPVVIYIRFLPAGLQNYTYSLELAGGGAQASVQLNGIGSNTDAKTYYISPQGNDNNDGSFDMPWYNLQKAVDAVLPGDTIICRGGVYYPSMKKDGTKTTVRLTASGTATKKITIKNYPNEFPILNFRDQPKKVSVRGIQLNGNYWHLYGLHITEAGDNGIKLEGNYNRIERCTFSYNDDTGLQLGFGHDFSATGFGSSNDGSYCAYNDIIDCDSYLNCDSDNFGSDADGFACKMHNGKGNRFIRCRAWDNADDAWDLFETDYAVFLIECWAWGSGRASLFTWVQASGSFQGNGNGIKLGGNGTGGSSKGKHEVWNCVAFNNNKTGSVKGFDQNSHGDGVKVVNSLAFGNGYDFMFEKSSYNCEYYNNVCFENIEIAPGSSESHNAMLSTSTKAWKNNIIRGFSAADYVSLSEDDAKAPRGENGSMPTRFARLKSGSALVDKGMLYNIPYSNEFPFLAQPVYGAARDLGPYELPEGVINTTTQIIINHEAKLSLSVSPNPCKVETVLKFSSDISGLACVKILNMNGVLVNVPYNNNIDAGIEYYIPVAVNSLRAGTYICQLTIGNQVKTTKLVIIK